MGWTNAMQLYILPGKCPLFCPQPPPLWNFLKASLRNLGVCLQKQYLSSDLENKFIIKKLSAKPKSKIKNSQIQSKKERKEIENSDDDFVQGSLRSYSDIYNTSCVKKNATSKISMKNISY